MASSRRAHRLAALGLLFLAQFSSFAAAWKTQGVLHPYTGTKFSFVGKFCFDFATAEDFTPENVTLWENTWDFLPPWYKSEDVIRAWYGRPTQEFTKSEFGRDVTQQVKDLLDQGTWVFASNDYLGGDPDEGIQKTLVVTMKVGKPSGFLEVNVKGYVPGEKPYDSKNVSQDNLPSMPSFPPTSGGLYLAIFSDKQDEWQSVRDNWNNLTAEEFLDRAAAVRAVTPVLPAGIFNASVRIEDSERPRFLYFVFVFWDTHRRGSMSVNYEIHATNPLSGFEAEFSHDERGAIVLQGWGLALFGGTLVFVVIGTRMALGAGALGTRPLLQLLLASCCCSALGCAATLWHSRYYAEHGVGMGNMQVVGELFATTARLLLSCLQLYIANGKALTNAPEEFARRLYIQVLVVGILFVSLGCEIYARYFGDLDWSTTLYFYASWPGFFIMLFNFLLFVEVVRSTNLLCKQPDLSAAVRRFYTFSFTAATLYFLALPATVGMSRQLPSYDRKAVVDRTELLTRFAATAILVFCLRPTRLDSMINARMELPENRQRAMELAGGLKG